uniref:high affinity immunoglobulin gamma Fc receptor I-like n=1 Tax=Semicossyphus pulcher TaxID=241346 RepID=UPI0037E75917
MEVSAVSLLIFDLVLNYLISGSAQVSVTVSPERSQFFKHEGFSVRCEEEKEEHVTGWRVMKRTKNGKVLPCPFACYISAAFPFTDSGEYWCESGQGATSISVNISVTADPVILVSPVLPVTEGDNVTLSCRCKTIQTSAWGPKATFYKDDVLIGGSATGNMTLCSVSRSDGGLYRCKILGYDQSPVSRLTVRGRDPPAPLLSPFIVVRHLVVGSPYLLSTILLGFICRDRARALRARKRRQTSNAVIMEMCQ